MTLSLVSRRAFPTFHPFLSAVFPMGNVVTYRSSWKPAPIEMETQPARSPLSLSLRIISFASSPSFSFCLSLSTSSLFVLRPPSHPNTPIYVPTYSRPALSPSFPNYLSPHRAPSYQLDSPGGLSILYPPSPIALRRGTLLFFHPLSLAPSPSSRPVSLV